MVFQVVAVFVTLLITAIITVVCMKVLCMNKSGDISPRE